MNLSELESLNVLLNMSQMEIMELRKKQDEEVAIKCAKVFPIDQ